MSVNDDDSSGGNRPAQDVLFVHSPTPSGDGLRVLRARNDALELGELHRMKEGQPIHGEVVTLSCREGSPGMFDVTTIVPAPTGPRTGPAKVTTSAYRSGWDAIFSGGEEPGSEPN